MQQQQKKVQKSMMPLHSCCYVKSKPSYFLSFLMMSPSSLLKLPINFLLRWWGLFKTRVVTLSIYFISGVTVDFANHLIKTKPLS